MTQKSDFIKLNLDSILTIYSHLMKFMVFSPELFLALLNRHCSLFLNGFDRKNHRDERGCARIVNFFLFLPSFLINPYVKNLIQIQKINDVNDVLCGSSSDLSCDLSVLYSMPHESIFSLEILEKSPKYLNSSRSANMMAIVNFIKNVVSVFHSVGLYDLNDCENLASYENLRDNLCESSSYSSFDFVKSFAKLHLEFFLNYVKCFELSSESIVNDCVCYIENVVKLFLSNNYKCNELKQYRNFLELFLDLDLSEREVLGEKDEYVSKSMSFVPPEIKNGNVMDKSFLDKDFLSRDKFLRFLSGKSVGLYEMSLLKNSVEKFYLNYAFSKNGVSNKSVNFRGFMNKCFDNLNVANRLFVNHLNNLHLNYEEKFYSIRKWKSYCVFFQNVMSAENNLESFSKKFDKCVARNVRFVSFGVSMLNLECGDENADDFEEKSNLSKILNTERGGIGRESLEQNISFQCFIDLVYLNENSFTENESRASELYFVFCDFYNNSEFYEIICSIILNSDKFDDLIQNFGVESKNCYLVVFSFASFKTYKYNLLEFAKVKKINEILKKIHNIEELGVNFAELDDVIRD